MPPKTVKKSPAGPGMKRPGRATRGGLKAHNNPESAAKESVEVEEVKAGEAAAPTAEFKVEESVKDEDNATAEEKPEAVKYGKEAKLVKLEVKAEEKGAVSTRKEDEVKESVDDYERGERLDLEDNDPEYEPEEYGGVDYDEKEIEPENIQEGDVEEEPEAEEADMVEEEEADMVEEEGDVHEQIEGEDDEEHAEEEHVEMTDAEAAAEEEEHHEVFNERRKRKEFEVFVGGLDKDATENDLRSVFSQVGKVTEVRLMMNPQTKKNKGFAFLRFATVEQAKRACTELKHPVVNGKQCGVTPSQDSDTLFLGNICKTWTKESLKDKLRHYAVENVDDLTLVEDSNNPGMNRGFAFLEFSSRSDAMDAFKHLQKRDVVFGVERPAKVSFADSFIDPGDEIMAQVKTVFIDGLSAYWDEDRVRELLKHYGHIEKVELARNMPSARRKDFGFVTFDSHDAAVNCAKSINNEELGEGNNKAKVRARLSRPLQRGKGKHISRGDLHYGRGASRSARGPWARPAPPSVPVRGTRGIGARRPPIRRPAAFRDRRPVMVPPPRSRPVAPPLLRSRDRRQPAPSFPKSSLKRDYGRREEIPPRSRAVADYSLRGPSDRRTSYRDDYPSREPGYHDVPRVTSRPAPRRAYLDDGNGPRYERPPPGYREGRSREYDSMSGSKRPYSALDDVAPRYPEAVVRHSRARLDYDYGSSGSQYGDAYGDRLGRSSLGYGSSRSSNSGQDSHGLYNSRHGMSYNGGSYGSSEVARIYPSGYGGDYMSRGSDVDGGSYSSIYSGRGLGGSGYMGSGSSGSYY